MASLLCCFRKKSKKGKLKKAEQSEEERQIQNVEAENPADQIKRNEEEMLHNNAEEREKRNKEAANAAVATVPMIQIKGNEEELTPKNAEVRQKVNEVEENSMPKGNEDIVKVEERQQKNREAKKSTPGPDVELKRKETEMLFKRLERLELLAFAFGDTDYTRPEGRESYKNNVNRARFEIKDCFCMTSDRQQGLSLERQYDQEENKKVSVPFSSVQNIKKEGRKSYMHNMNRARFEVKDRFCTSSDRHQGLSIERPYDYEVTEKMPVTISSGHNIKEGQTSTEPDELGFPMFEDAENVPDQRDKADMATVPKERNSKIIINPFAALEEDTEGVDEKRINVEMDVMPNGPNPEGDIRVLVHGEELKHVKKKSAVSITDTPVKNILYELFTPVKEPRRTWKQATNKKLTKQTKNDFICIKDMF